jgi:hypothetical protein
MQLFEVFYSLGQRADSGSWQGSSSTQNLRTTVQALHVGQARAMVEGMNGGYRNCQIHTANPL